MFCDLAHKEQHLRVQLYESKSQQTVNIHGSQYSVTVTKRSQDSQGVIRVTGSATSRPTITKLRVISRKAVASSLHEIDVGARRVLMLVVMLTQRGVSLFFVDI